MMNTDSQVVTVRVQVVDMQPFTLDLQVPTYLPARDLTQRIARDAGLNAYWTDGRRRLYWLRARGRLIGDGENLAELNVVDGELVYLLPEPPAGSGVMERPPAYPENRGYRSTGMGLLLLRLVGIAVWALGWGVAMSLDASKLVTAFPALGLGMLSAGFARHAWAEGRANGLRIPLTAAAVAVPCALLALTVGVIAATADPTHTTGRAVASLLFVLIGVLAGWLAWWGAVEPLPAKSVEEAAPDDTTAAVVPCGICGEDVGPEHRVECPAQCGRFFHTGCQAHWMAVHSGKDGRICVCGARFI